MEPVKFCNCQAEPVKEDRPGYDLTEVCPGCGFTFQIIILDRRARK